MLIVQPVRPEDFLKLVKMYTQMAATFAQVTTPPAATYALVTHMAKERDFISLGLYENDELKGFSTGFGLENNEFYFTGIYVEQKNKDVGYLIGASIRYISERGYTSFQADCNNKNIQSILVNKFDGTEMYTRCRVEI